MSSAPRIERESLFGRSGVRKPDIRGGACLSHAFGFEFLEELPDRGRLVGGVRHAIDDPKPPTDVASQRCTERSECRIDALDVIPRPFGGLVGSPVPVSFVLCHHRRESFGPQPDDRLQAFVRAPSSSGGPVHSSTADGTSHRRFRSTRVFDRGGRVASSRRSLEDSPCRSGGVSLSFVCQGVLPSFRRLRSHPLNLNLGNASAGTGSTTRA